MAVYRSKVDRGLAVLLLLIGGLPVLVLTIAAARDPVFRHETRWVLLILAVTFGFVLWLFLSTTYELGDRDLVVRAGPFRWRVPLDSLESARPARNPLSSPALSLDRLELRYGAGKWLLISPRDRDRFLQDLAARAPQIRENGDSPH